MSVKLCILVVALLAAAAAAVPVAFFGFGGGHAEGAYRGSIPPEDVRTPDFLLDDSGGGTLASADLRGKVALVTFLDTQCIEACPVIASHIGVALRSLDAEERRRVVALAISVDPEEDTAEAVRAFLKRHRVGGELHYLVAPEAGLRSVWQAFGVLPSVESGSDDLHSAPVRIYDRDGVWVSTLNAGGDLTPRNLAHDVRIALES